MDKVLVVDDDAHIVEVIAEFLEDDGLTVLTARNGQEALTIALREHPRLVLTDIMMPRMGGVELCRRLREEPGTRDTAVLLMSVVVRTDLSGCGAAGLIRKPFDLHDLARTVHRHLSTASLPA